MKVSTPLRVTLPAEGVLVAESVHATDFRMPERVDPFHKLLYVLQGRVAFHVGWGEVRKAEAGSLLVVPRQMRHAIDDLEPSTLLLLCLGETFFVRDANLKALWTELEELPEPVLRLSQPARHQLEAMWRRAMLEKSGARIGSAVAVRALAAQTLVLLARLAPAAQGDDSERRVAAVVREIEETFYDDWNLDRAAARAGLSRRRFSALFREQAGEAFLEYLVRLRLGHAARLLRAGEHSVTGVIFSCGFNDVSHFYRLFRAAYGAPPGEWLKNETNARHRRGRSRAGRGSDFRTGGPAKRCARLRGARAEGVG